MPLKSGGIISYHIKIQMIDQTCFVSFSLRTRKWIFLCRICHTIAKPLIFYGLEVNIHLDRHLLLGFHRCIMFMDAFPLYYLTKTTVLECRFNIISVIMKLCVLKDIETFMKLNIIILLSLLL